MTLSVPCISSLSSPQIPDTNTTTTTSNSSLDSNHINTNNSSNNSTDNNENSNETVPESIKKRPAKPHVKTACVNCKKAHLACDLTRPCKRCVSSDKADTCHDIQHKKRGRPKLRGIKPMHCHLPSTFTMIQSAPSNSSCVQQYSNTSNYQKPTMTIFLSMELCCARVSDESFDFLGLYPQEFSHRSLYDFITSRNSGTVSRIHRSLLDNAVTFYYGDWDRQDQQQGQQQQQQRKRARLLPPTQRTTADMFTTLPPYQLATIANGSLTLKDTISFITSDKSRHHPLDARFYLGGGSGADLLQPDSLQHLYIVCILTLPDSNLSLASPSEQQPLPNNLPLENDSGLGEPLYTTGNTLALETASTFPELQSIDFDQDQLQLSSPLESNEASILDFDDEQDDQRQLPSKRPVNDTIGSDVMDSTDSWMKPYTTPSPPLSPSSSFSLVLAASSPPYRNDSRDATQNGPSSAASSTKASAKVSKPSPSSLSSFKSSSKHVSSTSYFRQHHRHHQTYQQPHQLYYQTMLSSRLSTEAQAFASSTRMLTAPTMSTPIYNVAKPRRHHPHSTSNTQFHLLSSSSSSSLSSSSSSSSSSLSPSSSSICHSSPATTSNTTSTPLYTLPRTSTKMSIYYD